MLRNIHWQLKAYIKTIVDLLVQLIFVMSENFKLRVVLSTQVVKKIIFEEKPSSLNELYTQLKCKIDQMPNNFVLLYEDPDFNNSLVSLDDINDLVNCASVTVLEIEECIEQSSSSAFDVHPQSSSSLRTVTSWPDPFPIPDFDINVQVQLQQAQEGFQVPWVVKRDILQKLAITMYGYKAYPSDMEFETAARALVAKHPCLFEKGTLNGWNGWKNSLKFKMGNFRTTLSKLGCTEVKVNAGKKSKHSAILLPASAANIKKPKRHEINFLPNLEAGTNVEELEQVRKSVCDEYHRQPINASKIAAEMASTYATRREEIVCQKPPISAVVDRWPGLFLPSQVRYYYKCPHCCMLFVTYTTVVYCSMF